MLPRDSGFSLLWLHFWMLSISQSIKRTCLDDQWVMNRKGCGRKHVWIDESIDSAGWNSIQPFDAQISYKYYWKISLTSRKSGGPITQRSWFILFGEIIVVSCNNYTKHRKLPEPFHPHDCEDHVVTLSAVISCILVGIYCCIELLFPATCIHSTATNSFYSIWPWRWRQHTPPKLKPTRCRRSEGYYLNNFRRENLKRSMIRETFDKHTPKYRKG